MASHPVTTTIANSGLTAQQVMDLTGIYLSWDRADDGSDIWTVSGLQDLRKLHAFLEIRFTRVDGDWGIRGYGLRSGETVEVAKRDGSTTTVTVGEIVSDVDGVQTATIAPAAPAPVAAAPAAAPARTAPAARRVCRDASHDRDNSGRCYDCGGYDAGSDVGHWL